MASRPLLIRYVVPVLLEPVKHLVDIVGDFVIHLFFLLPLRLVLLGEESKIRLDEMRIDLGKLLHVSHIPLIGALLLLDTMVCFLLFAGDNAHLGGEELRLLSLGHVGEVQLGKASAKPPRHDIIPACVVSLDILKLGAEPHTRGELARLEGAEPPTPPLASDFGGVVP